MARASANARAVARILALGVAAVGVAACAPSRDQSESEALAAIAEFNREYLEAINTGDIDALAALTTEDHLMVSSGGAPLAGRQALVDAMTGAFRSVDIEESWSPEETVVSGDLAYQRGTFVVVATPKGGGESSRTTGNFLRIYRRQPDGRWFMVRDTFNSAAPR